MAEPNAAPITGPPVVELPALGPVQPGIPDPNQDDEVQAKMVKCFLNHTNKHALALPQHKSNSEQESRELRNYLVFLQRVAKFLSNPALSDGPAFYVHANPVRFISASTRASWAEIMWEGEQYASRQQMISSYDIVKTAANAYRATSRANYFLFMAEWPKRWEHTPYHKMMTDPAYDFNPTPQEKLHTHNMQHIRSCGAAAFVIKIENNTVTLYDPWFHKQNPTVVPGGGLPSMNDIFWTTIGQAFIKELQQKGLYVHQVGMLVGGGDFGNFPEQPGFGSSVEMCCSWIRDQLLYEFTKPERKEPMFPCAKDGLMFRVYN